MKKLVLSLATLLSANAAFGAELAHIDCMATNGVTIKSVAEAGEGQRVETHWGFLRRDFVAKLAAPAEGQGTQITLESESGLEYVISFDSKLARRARAQKVTGTITQPTGLRGMPDALIAYVSCELRVR